MHCRSVSRKRPAVVPLSLDQLRRSSAIVFYLLPVWLLLILSALTLCFSGLLMDFCCLGFFVSLFCFSFFVPFFQFFWLHISGLWTGFCCWHFFPFGLILLWFLLFNFFPVFWSPVFISFITCLFLDFFLPSSICSIFYHTEMAGFSASHLTYKLYHTFHCCTYTASVQHCVCSGIKSRDVLSHVQKDNSVCIH